MDEAFRDAISAGYGFDEPTLIIGSAMLADELFNDVRVAVPMSTLNRHGLVAGATGTGKTKTLQLLAGQLSKAGVPVFVADIKGDLTGLAARGDATHAKGVAGGAGRRDEREGGRAGRVARLDVRAVGSSGRVPVAVRQARRAGPCDGPFVR